jgi:histidinol-phosphate aminotransferase
MTGASQWLEQFEKVRPPYNIGVLNQVAGEFALEHLGVLDDQAALIRAERESLHAALVGLPGIEIFESRANFLLARVPDSGLLHRRLKEAGILVKDVGTMHPLLRNCLRLTVGTPEENRSLVESLRRIL